MNNSDEYLVLMAFLGVVFVIFVTVLHRLRRWIEKRRQPKPKPKWGRQTGGR